jgi:hypothetical protein
MVAAALLMSASAARAATINELQFKGSTLGCFDTAVLCSDYDPPTTVVAGGQTISFTGAAFDLMTDAAGSASFSVGTFTKSAGNFTNEFTIPFTLKVTFLIPADITGGQSRLLEAELEGEIAGKGNNLLQVDFANGWLPLEFTDSLGSGSFEFSVADPATINDSNLSRIVTGSIRLAEYEENSTLPPTSAVPEPASLLLLGGGLAALAARARRRRE